jgi:hypothetical protein
MSISPKHLSPKTTALITIIVLLLIIVGFSISPIRNYLAIKELDSVIKVLNSKDEQKNFEECKTILAFDKTKLSKNTYSHFASYE